MAGNNSKMQLPRSIIPSILPIARGIVSITFLLALMVGVQSIGTASATDANLEDGTLEIFRLADRTNLKRLDNGDFMFRLARDLRTGIVYWAYMGSTRHVVAVAPDWRALADDAVARAALLRIVDLPRRVGCGVGLIHRSWVYVVPEDVRFGVSGAAPDIRPVLVKGEVRNAVSGRATDSLLSYRNLVIGG